MKSIRFILFFSLGFLVFSCGSEPGSTGAEAQGAEAQGAGTPAAGTTKAESSDAALGEVIGTENEPFFKDNELSGALLKLVAGKWQNQGATGESIVFEGNKIRYFQDGKLTGESTFEIDPTCKRADCQGSMGWCMIETKGGNTTCKVVTRVDNKNLVVHPAGDKGARVSFVRVME